MLSVHPSRIIITHCTDVKDKKYNAVSYDDSDHVYPKTISVPHCGFSSDGKMSSQTMSKIKKAISYLSHVSSSKSVIEPISGKYLKFKLTFVTLTLSSAQMHSDNEIRRLLINQFIITAGLKQMNITKSNRDTDAGIKTLNKLITRELKKALKDVFGTHFHILTSDLTTELSKAFHKMSGTSTSSAYFPLAS